MLLHEITFGTNARQHALKLQQDLIDAFTDAEASSGSPIVNVQLHQFVGSAVTAPSLGVKVTIDLPFFKATAHVSYRESIGHTPKHVFVILYQHTYQEQPTYQEAFDELLKTLAYDAGNNGHHTFKSALVRAYKIEYIVIQDRQVLDLFKAMVLDGKRIIVKRLATKDSPVPDGYELFYQHLSGSKGNVVIYLES